MSPVLIESIDVLVPNLLPELISSAEVTNLKSLAGHLPPILQGGFECRLIGDSSQVDLQQCIQSTGSEREILKEYIAKVIDRGITSDSPWLKLQDFLRSWSQPDSLLNRNITEIWLEFDNQDTGASLPTPAIFLGFPQKVLPSAEIYPTLEKSLNLLLGESIWKPWQDNLKRCFEACSEPVFISHVGIMLSRNTPALRVNIKRLQSDTLMPYLQEIGWQNETESLDALARQLFPLVERITVCLDVGNKIYPKLGLECIFLHQPPEETRWEKLIEYLVAQKLCKPAKKETLLNWVGKTTPVNTKASWPSQLIIESLLKPTHLFTVFDRRLSHLKITWQPNHSLEAKAYLSFQHYWLSAKKINNEQ